MGSGCGSVGRTVASDTKDPQFKSRRWQNFISQLYDREDENKEKEAGNFFLKKKLSARSKLSQFDFKDFLFFFLPRKPKTKGNLFFILVRKVLVRLAFVAIRKVFAPFFISSVQDKKMAPNFLGRYKNNLEGFLASKF